MLLQQGPQSEKMALMQDNTCAPWAVRDQKVVGLFSTPGAGAIDEILDRAVQGARTGAAGGAPGSPGLLPPGRVPQQILGVGVGLPAALQ